MILSKKLWNGISLAGLMTATAFPAQAADITWTGATNNDWTVGTNWLGDVAPAGADRAIIANTANDPVLDGAAAVISELRAGAVGGSTLTIQNSGSLRTTTGHSYLGLNTGTNGEATVTGNGSLLRSDRDLYVGYSGRGTLNVTAGGDVITDGNTIIGYNAGGNGTGQGTALVTGAGSTLEANAELTIARETIGSLAISDSASVNADSNIYLGNLAGADGTLQILSGGSLTGSTFLYIGNNSGSTGDATVDGAGSTLHLTGEIRVGSSGNGSLSVENGGSVSNDASFYIGNNSGSIGTASVTGGGSTLHTGNQMFVGSVGTGSLSVQNDGAVTSDSNFYVGANNGGNGTLTVETGGDVTSTTYIYIANNAGSTGQGTINGNGSTMHADSGLRIGHNGTGTLDVENGADISTGGSTYIGNGAGSNGTLTLTGAGTTLDSNAEISIGVNSIGALNVLAGATARSLTNNIVFGQNNITTGTGHGTGTGLVSGAGSLLDADNQLRVGNNGTGSLTVEDGGAATAASAVYVGTNAASSGTLNIRSGGSLTGNDFIYVANAATSTGDVLVDGAGSQIQGAQLRVGNNGTGTLTVENGGSAVSTGNAAVGNTGSSTGTLTVRSGGSFDSGGFLYFAANSAASTGNGTVTGAGSLLHSDGDLSFGHSGTSTFTVEDGAGATTDSAMYVGANGGSNGTLDILTGADVQSGGSILIGNSAASTGAVTVNGTGSTLHSGNEIFVGNNGTGTLDILGGGSASTVSHTQVGLGGGSTGTLTVNGAGSSFLGGNQFFLGNSGDGILMVEDGGNVTISDYIHFGLSAGGTGTATISGNGSTLQGNTELLLGTSGDGILNVEDGGSVRIADYIHFGLNAGATGTATVTGTGSNLHTDTQLFIGSSAGGVLTVDAGGSVSADDFVHLGLHAGSTGSATIRGAGALLQGGTQLFIGNNGTGTLNIENGGNAVFADYIHFGLNAGRSGSATVTGAGSELHSDTQIFVGSSGDGELTLVANGAVSADGGLVIAANATATGTLNIGADALSAAAAAGIVDAATVSFGAGTGNIVFNHTDTGYIFDSALSGGGDIDLLAGETVFTGNSAGYTGVLDVQGGIARVNGDMGAADAMVGTGARIGGSGYINNLTVNAGGEIAPGNSIGTFHVMGDFTHDANATYQVEVNSSLGSDLIDVGGIANLDGFVAVTMEAGSYAPSSTYTILTAAGGLNGTFDSVSSINMLFDADLSYDANNVFLTLSRSGFTFDDIVPGPIGQSFDAVPDNDPSTQLLLASNDAAIAQSLQDAAAAPYPAASAGVAQVVDKIQSVIGNRIGFLQDSRQSRTSGTRTAGAGFNALEPAAGFNLGDALQGSAPDRLALQNFDAGFAPQGNAFGVWLQGYGLTGTTEQGGKSLDYTFSGLAGGFDYWLSPELLAGLTVSYTRGQSDVGPANADADTTLYQLAGYVAYASGPWTWQAIGGYGRANTDAQRNILFGGLPVHLTADYDTDIWQAAAEGGYGFDLKLAGNAVTLTPLAGASYSRQMQDSFTERGGPGALSLDDDTTQSLKPSLGIRAEAAIATAGGTVTPALTARLRHELADTTTDTDGRFAAAVGGPSFAVGGIERARTEADLEAGVSYDTDRNLSYYAAYGTTQSATTSEHSGMMGVKVRF